MTRYWPAIAVLLPLSAPALAQAGPPQAAPPAWVDPQAPQQSVAANGQVYAGPLVPTAAGMPSAGYTYAYSAPTAAPCGCPGYSYAWVPVQVHTNYVYSPPVRHVQEMPEEHIVYDEVVSTRTVPAPRETKYVKTARPAKLTTTKTVRSAK